MNPEDIDDLFKRVEKIMNSNFYGGYTRRRQYEDDYEREVSPAVEDEDHIYITLELRGVADEDIEVIPHSNELSLEVMYDGRWRKRTYPLPCEVDPKSAKISFINFILDIELDKVKNEEIRKEDNLR